MDSQTKAHNWGGGEGKWSGQGGEVVGDAQDHNDVKNIYM